MSSNILLRNNVKIFGKGTQTLLFAHGFGCDQNMWRFITPAFENDYRIVLFDYVGSGRSDRTAYDPTRYSTLSGYAQDVLDIRAALDLQNAIYVGHSVSGMIGVLAAIQEPGYFDRMVLIAPSPCYINDAPDYIGGFEREDIVGLLDMMQKNYLGWASFLAPLVVEEPKLAAEQEESFCSTDPDIAHRFAEATFLSDNRSDLHKVTVPSLILQCTDDVIAPHTVGAYLERHLPLSTLRLMQATGHSPHMSHPEETVQRMREYLTTLDSHSNADG